MRLAGFRYQEGFAYLVTIVVAGRVRALSAIHDGKIELTPIGMICRSAWAEIPDHFRGAVLHELIVMPDHVHGLLEFAPGTRSSLPPTIGGFKSAVTRRARLEGLWGSQPLWQRGYHDRILGDRVGFLAAMRYLRANPANWRG